MTLRRVPSRWFVLPLLVVLIVPQGLFGAAGQGRRAEAVAGRQREAAEAVQVGGNDRHQHERRGEVPHPEAVLLRA